MNQNPYYTIIIPVYNSQETIVSTIRSVQNQTLSDFELIIVDDGSTDQSKVLIENEITNDERIRYYYQNNSKQGAARNLGMSVALGKYFIFLDSDDTIERDLLRKVKDVIDKKNPDIVLMGYRYVNCEGEVLKEFDLYKKASKYKHSVIDLLPASPCMMIVEKQFILQNNIKFIENVFFEDINYSILLQLYAKNVEVLNYVGYNYLIRKDSSVRGGDCYRNIDAISSFTELHNQINKDVYDSHLDLIELNAVRYLIIEAVLRIYKSNNSKADKSDCIDTIFQFMNKGFPSWKKNRGIKKLSLKYNIFFFLVKHNFNSVLRFLLKLI